MTALSSILSCTSPVELVGVLLLLVTGVVLVIGLVISITLPPIGHDDLRQRRGFEVLPPDHSAGDPR